MITAEQAYEIDTRVYRGEEVTVEERQQVAEVLNDILDNPDKYHVRYLLWVSFSAKDYEL